MKKGFTIIELLLVIGIIGILLGIVTNVATGALKSARTQRAEAIVELVQQGLYVYHAQEGQWPGPVGTTLAGGGIIHVDEENGQKCVDYELKSDEVRQTVKDMVEKARLGRPVMDISGLYVSKKPGEKGSRAFGLDFMTAIHGSKKNQKDKMRLVEMYFGYPEAKTGNFRRLYMFYNPQTDQMRVSLKERGEE